MDRSILSNTHPLREIGFLQLSMDTPMTLKFHPSTLTGHILTLEFYLPEKNIFEVIQNLIMGGGGG